jgi:Uma2 family endonuclease
MAPTTASHLTLQEYDRLYGHESGWEYWDGEAIRKPVPTFLHGLLSVLLCDLLRQAGYFSSFEVDLHASADWSPRPDACGVLSPVDGRYPTQPVDVVFEVRSEGDQVVAKCRRYRQVGIPQIFVLDAENKTISEWSGDRLVPVVDVALLNGVTITGRTIWSEMARRQNERQEPPASGVI